MADLRVFVSSTCFDLAVIRDQLRSFLVGLGHTPVMSDYSDVLYDPREHTHTSCLLEVGSCDAVIVIVGGRFGGPAFPQAIAHIDPDKLASLSASSWLIENHEKISVTQLEVLRAVEESTPVFTFVEDRVMHDHLVYEKNKAKPILADITFPSIERAESARYIFEFINFLRHRVRGNSIHRFVHLEDITVHLRRQWSGLFQRLLFEQKHAARQARTVSQLSDQLDALRAAVLSSIEAPTLRETARGVVRFRRLIDLLGALNVPLEFVRGQLAFADLIRAVGVGRVVEVLQESGEMTRHRLVLVRVDGSFVETRMPPEVFRDLLHEWGAFLRLAPDIREAIFEAWRDRVGPGHFRRSAQNFRDVFADAITADVSLVAGTDDRIEAEERDHVLDVK